MFPAGNISRRRKESFNWNLNSTIPKLNGFFFLLSFFLFSIYCFFFLLLGKEKEREKVELSWSKLEVKVTTKGAWSECRVWCIYGPSKEEVRFNYHHSIEISRSYIYIFYRGSRSSSGSRHNLRIREVFLFFFIFNFENLLINWKFISVMREFKS